MVGVIGTSTRKRSEVKEKHFLAMKHKTQKGSTGGEHTQHPTPGDEDHYLWANVAVVTYMISRVDESPLAESPVDESSHANFDPS